MLEHCHGAWSYFYVRNDLLSIFSFFWKMGKIQSPVTRPQIAPIPFGTDILNRLDMRIHKVPSKIYHTYKEKLSKWRLSAKLFFLLVIFGQFWAPKPNKYSKINDFVFLSVSFLLAKVMKNFHFFGTLPLMFVARDPHIVLSFFIPPQMTLILCFLHLF